jgi:serine/threonine protein kinase
VLINFCSQKPQAIKIALDTALGVRYLHGHSPPIIHRDLKSSNLLVDQQLNVRLCDFGLARIKLAHQKANTFCGSAFWVPSRFSFHSFLLH